MCTPTNISVQPVFTSALLVDISRTLISIGGLTYLVGTVNCILKLEIREQHIRQLNNFY